MSSKTRTRQLRLLAALGCIVGEAWAAGALPGQAVPSAVAAPVLSFAAQRAIDEALAEARRALGLQPDH